MHIWHVRVCTKAAYNRYKIYICKKLYLYFVFVNASLISSKHKKKSILDSLKSYTQASMELQSP